MDQVDIFGETQSLEPAAEVKPRDAIAWTQSRLFEPQMEGQLTLDETQLPNEGSSTDGIV